MAARELPEEPADASIDVEVIAVHRVVFWAPHVREGITRSVTVVDAAE